jgi:hypothetical protein
MTGGGGYVDPADDDWVRRTAWGSEKAGSYNLGRD